MKTRSILLFTVIIYSWSFFFLQSKETPGVVVSLRIPYLALFPLTPKPPHSLSPLRVQSACDIVVTPQLSIFKPGLSFEFKPHSSHCPPVGGYPTAAQTEQVHISTYPLPPDLFLLLYSFLW